MVQRVGEQWKDRDLAAWLDALQGIGWAVEDGPCADELDACRADTACGLLLQCYQDCDAVTQACIENCNDVVPSGVPLFQQVAACAACGACSGQCAGSSLTLLC